MLPAADDASPGPALGDAFGMLLLDCLQAGLDPGRFTQIVERSDRLIQLGDPVRYFACEPWSDQEAFALSRANGKVLDVGAGAGRLSLYLQARGLEVVALDVSPLAIEICRRRGAGQVFVGSAEDLAASAPSPFDTFLLAGGNLGLMRDSQSARVFLDALASMAAPGAVVIGSGRDPYQTEDPDHLNYHAANRARGRMAGQVTIRVRHRRWATDWFDLLFTRSRSWKDSSTGQHGSSKRRCRKAPATTWCYGRVNAKRAPSARTRRVESAIIRKRRLR